MNTSDIERELFSRFDKLIWAVELYPERDNLLSIIHRYIDWVSSKTDAHPCGIATLTTCEIDYLCDNLQLDFSFALSGKIVEMSEMNLIQLKATKMLETSNVNVTSDLSISNLGSMIDELKSSGYDKGYLILIINNES